ncbi:MAG TPA: hypothetical protein VFC31_11020 [Candidatus Limnocylindria bacterium]|nr:hypothetical protein [Candidatus Limnocylindria bacterium]
MTPERPVRVVRTIVCAFSRDELPADDLQVFRRFEHAVKKAGWAIRVRLEPIESLPESYDVLVVSPALRERAERLEGDALLVVTTRQTAGAAAEQLLREIERGDPVGAERADPNAPRIVTHRGMEIL